MDLQHDIEVKAEEIAKESVKAGKKTFMFIINAEAEILKGTVNFATFIPKQVIDGLCSKSNKTYKGRQSVKKLLGSGAKLEDIPIKEENMGDFKSVARKYGIDYSLKKIEHEGKTQCVVFFKSKDVNVLTAAFKEYTAKITEKENKKKIKERISENRKTQRTQKRELKREKKRNRGVEL